MLEVKVAVRGNLHIIEATDLQVELEMTAFLEVFSPLGTKEAGAPGAPANCTGTELCSSLIPGG